jgi:hypothetical protein
MRLSYFYRKKKLEKKNFYIDAKGTHHSYYLWTHLDLSKIKCVSVCKYTILSKSSWYPHHLIYDKQRWIIFAGNKDTLILHLESKTRQKKLSNSFETINIAPRTYQHACIYSAFQRVNLFLVKNMCFSLYPFCFCKWNMF